MRQSSPSSACTLLSAEVSPTMLRHLQHCSTARTGSSGSPAAAPAGPGEPSARSSATCAMGAGERSLASESRAKIARANGGPFAFRGPQRQNGRQILGRGPGNNGQSEGLRAASQCRRRCAPALAPRRPICSSACPSPHAPPLAHRCHTSTSPRWGTTTMARRVSVKRAGSPCARVPLSASPAERFPLPAARGTR